VDNFKLHGEVFTRFFFFLGGGVGGDDANL